MKEFFILIFVLVIFYVALIYLPTRDIKETFSGDTSLQAKPEHFELAYQWCATEPDGAPRDFCDKYVYHYDSLNSSFSNLKKHFCTNYPKECTKLGLV